VRRAAVAALLLLAGCAYNGMYHARRLSNAAEKAERDGRTMDANAYWGQVTVKAETLLARYPESGYSVEARLLLGRARAHLNDCPAARQYLQSALPVLTDSADTRDAAAELARCDLALGDYAAAAAGFRALVGKGTPGQQRATLLDLARSLRLAGRPEDAIAALEGAGGPGIPEERLRSLAMAGRVPESVALADSLIAQSDSTAPWDSVLAALGAADPLAASHLLDRLAPFSAAQRHEHSRRLLDDARRLESVDPVRMEQRLTEAAGAGGDGGAAAMARFRLLRASLAKVATVGELAGLEPELERSRANPALAAEAEVLGGVFARIRSADSMNAATPQGDLRLFLAAEAARDTLRSGALAASLFRRVGAMWPGSPYAPKALLAAELLVPAREDLLALLDTLYPASPYVAHLRGEDLPELRALEDSLGEFAVAAARERRPAPTPKDSLDQRRKGAPAQRPRPGTPGTTVPPR
jgi:tetratricopeptide (TPR) repeat protein